MTEISAIIVNHNDKTHLRACLEGLPAKTNIPSMETIVVDNASTDGSQDMLRENFPEVRLVQNQKNSGFSAACNLGFLKSKGEFILFLNPDAFLATGTLDRLLQEMHRFPKTGAAGPVLRRKNHLYQVSFGGKRTFFLELINKFIINPFWLFFIRFLHQRKKVTWLSGACLLVRRRALEQTAGFDEHFFLYYEDIDLCYRINEKGWDIVLVPAAKASHIGGTATEKNRLFSQYHYRKSQLHFYSKHNSRLSNFLLRFALKMQFFLLPSSKELPSRGNSLTKQDFHRLLEE